MDLNTDQLTILEKPEYAIVEEAKQQEENSPEENKEKVVAQEDAPANQKGEIVTEAGKKVGALSFDLLNQQAIIEVRVCREFLKETTSNHGSVLKMYDKVVGSWQKEYQKTKGKFDLPRLLDAVQFATIKHKGQFRKDPDKTPYIIHPMGVARILWEAGEIRDTDILIIALLHDTVEDTKTTADEIESLFGSRVKEAVVQLTNDPKLSGKENRKKQIEHVPQMSRDAKLVKLADRTYNLIDLTTRRPPHMTKEHVAEYFDSSKQLLAVLKETHSHLEAVLQKSIELESEAVK